MDTRDESALDDTLIGIESLSSEYLTHRILDPKILSRYLEAIADDIEDMTPDYKPEPICNGPLMPVAVTGPFEVWIILFTSIMVIH